MSEQAAFDPGFQLPTMIDPAVQRSFDMMREFQEELDLSPDAPVSRVNEMLQILDAGWLHNNEIVFLSGNIRSAIVDVQEAESDAGDAHSTITTMTREDGSQPLCTYFSNGGEFTSHGFLIDEQRFLVGEGYDIGARYVLQLLFSRNVFVHVTDKPEPVQCLLKGFASADDVAMEFAYDSYEYNEQVAREYFPEATKEIDDKVDDCNRIADNIMALKGIAIDCDEYVTDKEIMALEAYVDGLINVKRDREGGVPYLVNLRKGTCFFGVEDKTKAIDVYSEKSTAMVAINGVVIAPKMKPKGNDGNVDINPNKLEFRVLAHVLGEDDDADTIEIEIRLRDIQAMNSIRQVFYGE